MEKVGIEPTTLGYQALRSANCATSPVEWSNHIMGGRERAKHIDIRKHFANEAVKNGHIRLFPIPTEFQLAEVLTKGIHRSRFECCLYSLLGEDPPLAGSTT